MTRPVASGVQRRAHCYHSLVQYPNPGSELARLRTQAITFWAKEARILRHFGLRRDMDILEIGAGPGFATELLIGVVPEGSVTCLEIEHQHIALARERLGDYCPRRLRFVEGSILDSPLLDESFDLVHARFVLQHISAPARALAEMYRMVRPGGSVVIVDVNDRLWGSVFPERHLPAFERLILAHARAQARAGGDRFIGGRIPQMLRAAGFSDIAVEPVAVSSDEVGIQAFEPFFNIRSRQSLSQTMSDIALEAVARLADAMDDFLAAPDSSAMLMFFMFSGRKRIL